MVIKSIFKQVHLFEIPYRLKFSRDKYFAVLPNSAQKQIFMDKIFVVKLPAVHCSCYEVEILREKIFAAMLRPTKSAKIFNLENFRLYGILWLPRTHTPPLGLPHTLVHLFLDCASPLEKHFQIKLLSE